MHISSTSSTFFGGSLPPYFFNHIRDDSRGYPGVGQLSVLSLNLGFYAFSKTQDTCRTFYSIKGYWLIAWNDGWIGKERLCFVLQLTGYSIRRMGWLSFCFHWNDLFYLMPYFYLTHLILFFFLYDLCLNSFNEGN